MLKKSLLLIGFYRGGHYVMAEFFQDIVKLVVYAVVFTPIICIILSAVTFSVVSSFVKALSR